MITIIMKKVKEHISARVSHVAKLVIDAEVKARGLKSTADFVELAIFQAANCAESRRLMLEEIKGDPKISAMLAAFGVKMPADKPKNN